MSKGTTKKEAEVQLLQKQSEMSMRYCPVFKEQCKGESCMGYYAGTVWDKGMPDDITYIVAEPLCLSPLVTGTITMDRDW